MKKQISHLKETILHKVTHDSISMIPRWKFVMYSLLFIFASLFVAGVVIFCLSLFLFVLSSHGMLHLSFFDFVAMLMTIKVLPALLLIFTLILVGVLHMIARRYTVAFRWPLLSVFLLISMVAVALSYFVSETPLHTHVRNFARGHHVGMMEHMYDRPHDILPGRPDVIRGEVLSVASSSFRIRAFDGKEFLVNASRTEEYSPSLLSQLQAGDDVTVFGSFTQDGDTFDMLLLRAHTVQSSMMMRQEFAPPVK